MTSTCLPMIWNLYDSGSTDVLETVVSLLKLHSDTSSSEFGRDQSSGVCKTFQVPSHELNLKTINLFFAAGNIAKKRKDL